MFTEVIKNGLDVTNVRVGAQQYWQNLAYKSI